ncbi:MAG TPA: insulinase family protein, partial [Chthoniobacterales bacterium]|nr:insulinase family protein [Chthoniobacterales bacterium]
GKLPNGLRYVVRPNPEPKGRASLRLLVLAGSLQETEDQRGLAHFLEHMAFNGSAHYPPGTLVEFFQRMGMNFGADANANTNFDHTVYLLELAHSDDATITEGLRVLSDDAGGLLLTDEEINKERGVVLSELRVRDSVGYRTFVARTEAILGATLFPQRQPGGLPEVITKAQRDRFTDFWNTWYRPEKMVVIVVGDFADAGAVEKMIASAFAGLTARAPSRPEPTLGEVAKFNGVRAIFHAEPEAPATQISLTSMSPYTKEPDTAALHVKRLPRTLALAMLNRRFSILAKKENAPFRSAHASVGEYFKFFREANVDITCQAEQWTAALALGEQELRRALEHGFTPAELAVAAAELTNHFEQAAKTAPTWPSNRIADEIGQLLVAGNVFTTPADDLSRLKPAIEKVTPGDCLNALKDAFPSEGRFVIVAGNAKISGDPAAAITTAYNEAHAVAVAAPDAEKKAVWDYTNFGAPGEIAKREHIGDLDVELLTFKNGVRLNLKKTNFETGRIILDARVGNGGITEPVDRPGLARLATGTFTQGGFGKHSLDDLRSLFAGKNIGWRFGAAPDAFRFGGGTTRDDLLLELQLLAAHLSDAGYRPEALRVARKQLEQQYLSFKHTAAGPLNTEIANLLADGDRRFGLPSEEIMRARNLDELKAWLTPQLGHGAIEVALVGDLDIDAAIAAAARTIGALPPREPKPALTELKKVKFPSQPFTKRYGFDSEIPKASLRLYWPTDDALDIRRSRRLQLLAAILTDRLRVKVREELGESYSPQAQNDGSDTFPGYGYMVANIDVAPGDAEKISNLVVDLADELAQKGVTDDQLARAREPLLTAYRQSLRSNNYWLSVIGQAQEKPQMLDWTRTRFADVEAITSAEMSALAKKYLSRDRVSRATISPETKTTPP